MECRFSNPSATWKAFKARLTFHLASPAKWSGPDTSGGFDWIELTSGEWLKGEIKSMQNDKLEFDSDKLGLLTLDWEDVRQVRAHLGCEAPLNGQ